MIVVDLGCKTYQDEDSTGLLLERYRPSLLFGFDPAPALTEAVESHDGAVLVTRRLAAWWFDGLVGYQDAGSRSKTRDQYGLKQSVRCFDLATFLTTLGRVDVLKMDVEGAEFVLIPYLLGKGIDGRVGTLLVEWHDMPVTCEGAWTVEPWEH